MNLNLDQWNCYWNGRTDETNKFIFIPLLLVFIYVEKPEKLGITQLKTYLLLKASEEETDRPKIL